MSLSIPPRAPLPTEAELADVAAIPGLARALALYRIDMRTEATREWLWTIRGMDDRKLLAAAELARRNEAWDRAISTADRTVARPQFLGPLPRAVPRGARREGAIARSGGVLGAGRGAAGKPLHQSARSLRPGRPASCR